MTTSTLVWRSLRHYWRGNLVVVAGVATAVAVLTGALLVGDSVRGTLRDLATVRLGAADLAVVSPGFFRTAVADAVAADERFGASFTGLAPLVALDGLVTVQTTGRRAGDVRVYGVDDRFWRFHGRSTQATLAPRQAYISAALAEETGAEVDSPLLVRVQWPTDIPLESLHGRKDDPGRSIRATVAALLPAEALGDFSLSQTQGRVRAVFVSLPWLNEALDIGERVNTLLVRAAGETTGDAANLAPLLRRHLTPADLGLTIRPLSTEPVTLVGSSAGLLDDGRVAAVERAADASGFGAERVLTYLANTIRIGAREVPYSLVTARERLPREDGSTAAPRAPMVDGGPPPIWLNIWAARDLSAGIGEPVELEYFRWIDPGALVTERASFRMAGVLPNGPGDRLLAPDYPGITDSPTLDDWNPPFPVDLRRVRPVDEAYWKEFRTTPKAFIRFEDGRRLWASRYGQVTSLQLRVAEPPPNAAPSFEEALARELDPAALGIVVREVRREALAASTGVTDFGQYFVYFSFFLVVSALVLAALFFKLGVDERVREVGILSAVGAEPRFIVRYLLAEASLLAIGGGLIGLVAALAYASGIIVLLRTWWVDAVGTSALEVYATPTSLIVGFVGGVAAASACTLLAIRGVTARSTRALLAGTLEEATARRVTTSRRAVATAITGLLVAGGLVLAGLGRLIPLVAAFFGAGAAMLVTGLAATAWALRRPGATALVAGRGPGAVAALGFRGASANPGRSALAVSVLASAVFIVLAVDVFRKGDLTDTGPTSGVGGYSLTAESLLPVAHDFGTASGREAGGLSPLDAAVRFDAFRLRPGDDASCLNLYQPANPRLLGARREFLERGRFRFRDSLATTEAERANPWLLLSADQADGAVPVIADANSLTYVLHKAVGDVIELPHASGTVRLRVVAALADSLFQRDLLISEAAFVRLFPEQEGYRFWLIETPETISPGDVASTVEDRLAPFGLDAVSADDLLAEFHRVENTYLTTFQTLGALGLLLGTIGFGAILLRAVVERRRELALLQAVGFRPGDVRLMLLAESAVVVGAGLAIGLLAALVASVPAIVDRGGRSPLSATALVVAALVVVCGVISTSLASRAVTRRSLLGGLRAE